MKSPSALFLIIFNLSSANDYHLNKFGNLGFVGTKSRLQFQDPYREKWRWQEDDQMYEK